MDQLALFQGPHVPRTAARQALAHGRLDEARAQLERLAGASEEAADAARLARIAGALGRPGDDAARTVHSAFEEALSGDPRRGFLTPPEWFALYARELSQALAGEPTRAFRGWLGAHFAFAGGPPDAAWRAALGIVEEAAPGPAWLEAGRLAFALGHAGEARAWVHAACLDAPSALEPAPAVLEPCAVAALDGAPELPRLPAPVEDAFDTTRALDDLPGPGPWTRWVAVVGEIDRVLTPARVDDAEATGPDEEPARAFLAALRAARRARERDRRDGAVGCSDRELRARQRMKRLAPSLLGRYVRGVDAGLF